MPFGGWKTGSVFDTAAATIERAGFEVIRDPIEGTAKFGSHTFDTNYMNWLVGNGFVITVGFGIPDTDDAAKNGLKNTSRVVKFMLSKCCNPGQLEVECIAIPMTSQPSLPQAPLHPDV